MPSKADILSGLTMSQLQMIASLVVMYRVFQKTMTDNGITMAHVSTFTPADLAAAIAAAQNPG